MRSININEYLKSVPYILGASSIQVYSSVQTVRSLLIFLPKARSTDVDFAIMFVPQGHEGQGSSWRPNFEVDNQEGESKRRKSKKFPTHFRTWRVLETGREDRICSHLLDYLPQRWGVNGLVHGFAFWCSLLLWYMSNPFELLNLCRWNKKKMWSWKFNHFRKRFWFKTYYIWMV